MKTGASDSAVGVPDVAGLIEMLRGSFFHKGDYQEFMWPLPNLHEEAADALTALQGRLADAMAMASHYEDAFARRSSQNEQQAEKQEVLLVAEVVPVETARKLERMCGELAEALAHHMELTRPIHRTTEAIAKWQKMKDAAK